MGKRVLYVLGGIAIALTACIAFYFYYTSDVPDEIVPTLYNAPAGSSEGFIHDEVPPTIVAAVVLRREGDMITLSIRGEVRDFLLSPQIVVKRGQELASLSDITVGTIVLPTAGGITEAGVSIIYEIEIIPPPPEL